MNILICFLYVFNRPLLNKNCLFAISGHDDTLCTSSTKTNLERVIILSETENTHPQNYFPLYQQKSPTNHENWPHNFKLGIPQ